VCVCSAVNSGVVSLWGGFPKYRNILQQSIGTVTFDSVKRLADDTHSVSGAVFSPGSHPSHPESKS